MADSAEGFAVCPVCPHHCRIAEGKSGRCRGRGTKNGKVVPLNYGRVTSLALDPIEKKPFRKFFPGSGILSVGSYDCNLNCPFCQNWEISMSDGQDFRRGRWGGENGLSPETLAGMAAELRARGNIGVAFTYNEPLISWEYVLDTAKLVRKNNMKSVLVTNGCFSGETADAVLPWIDALNIDLKSFQENVYKDTLGGDLETVKSFIGKAAEQCHTELTCLIVPGMNDTEEEMQAMVQWIGSLPGGEEIPLHITRFFPRYRVLDREPTDRSVILHLTEIARQHLKHVYPGNL
ncbi:MAG: AmmeMemoRadiSam system radical SAM enzyme [Oscillospiraceae bacterium]|nr:AmmeMemoRadiSam system radical SAM enzyme [Oscillospiraceae bacterium]